MNFGKGLLIFVSGMVAGGFVIAKALENHYAQIADEEIEEMKKHTKELIDEAKGVNIKKDEEEPWNKPEESSIESKNKYKSIVRDYTKPEREVIDPGFETKVDRSKPSLESMATNVRQWKEEEEMNKPYIITDDEYAEDNGYAKETVWLYEVDGALVGDNDEILFKSGDKIHIKDGSKVVFIKLVSSKVQDYNVPINFKGWFPENDTANIGDDRGYEIIFPPANILKKYSVGSGGKLYPVVAYDTLKKQDIAKIIVELD